MHVIFIYFEDKNLLVPLRLSCCLILSSPFVSLSLFFFFFKIYKTMHIPLRSDISCDLFIAICMESFSLIWNIFMSSFTVIISSQAAVALQVSILDITFILKTYLAHELLHGLLRIFLYHSSVSIYSWSAGSSLNMSSNSWYAFYHICQPFSLSSACPL